MAGRSRAKTTPATPTIPSNSLVASAVRYPGKVARVYVGAKEWQRECYRHYTICGEARYAANYYGHTISRATLYATESARKDAPRLTEGIAVDALDALFNGAEGQEAMLTAMGIHLTVAGECYLVGREVQVEGSAETDEVWEVLAVTEVKKTGELWSITSKEDGEPDIVLPEEATIIRIWRPHPERRLEADSPFRSLLPVLREIEHITLRIFAECISRLTGAGMMFVSQDVTFPEPPKEIDGNRLDVNGVASGLLYTLAEAMLGAANNPGSPESIMPIVATVPSEVLANGKVAEMLHFWTALDENAQGMRNGAIQRFALGMDMPPEKLLGISSNSGTGGGTTNGVSHWGAWQIDEDYIRLHIEPDIGLICNALVIGFLRPITAGDEYLRGDTKELRLRPDRSKEAAELYDRGLISGVVVVRENGFNPDTDMMSPEEQKRWLTIKVATGSATPEQVQAALRELGVDLGDLLGTKEPTRETRPDPSLVDHPTRRPPEPASSTPDLLMAVCEPLVYRALERAGNKLRQRGKGGVQPTGVAAYEVHTVLAANGSVDAVLDDAFSTASMCLNGVAPASEVVPVLEAYVRTLVTQQRPHERHLLATALEDVA